MIDPRIAVIKRNKIQNEAGKELHWIIKVTRGRSFSSRKILKSVKIKHRRSIKSSTTHRKELQEIELPKNSLKESFSTKLASSP